jgi:hypothetical protein
MNPAAPVTKARWHEKLIASFLLHMDFAQRRRRSSLRPALRNEARAANELKAGFSVSPANKQIRACL